MGSTGNPNPWGPYDSYKDCSQGVCSVYCPQWCYIIFPPPPSFFLDEEDDSSSSDFSPLLIALIGILASAFILVSYYTLISKYCHRRRNNPISTTTRDHGFSTDSWPNPNPNPNPNPTIGDGLDESLIKSITVYKFRKGDGFVESSDCSVCLSEFQEKESLRLLPKCNHAFHVPCIDTWLKSHSNCPLCRAFITAGESNQPIETENDAISNDRDSDSDSDSDVVVNLDLETRSPSERSNPKPPEMEGSRDGEEEEEEEEQMNRRSASVNSGTVVLIADILREIEDDEESAGVGTSRRVEEGDGGEKTPPPPSAANQTNGISSFLARSSMAMKRSVSTGKFVYDRSRNYRLPN